MRVNRLSVILTGVLAAGSAISPFVAAQPLQAQAPAEANATPYTGLNLIRRFLVWQSDLDTANAFNESLIVVGALQALVAAFQLATYRKQARIMDKQTVISQDLSKLQKQQNDFAATMSMLTQRAVVSYNEIEWERDDPPGFWSISIKLENYGPIPAQDVVIASQWDEITPATLANFEPSFIDESDFVPIPPRLVFTAANFRIPTALSRSASTEDDGSGIIIAVCYLRLRYKDMFSKHVHLRSSKMQHRVQLCFIVKVQSGQTEDALHFQPISKFCSDGDLYS